MRSGGATIDSDGDRPLFVRVNGANFWPLFNILRLCFDLINALVFKTCLHFFGGERVIMRDNHMDEQHARRTDRARAAQACLHAI